MGLSYSKYGLGLGLGLLGLGVEMCMPNVRNSVCTLVRCTSIHGLSGLVMFTYS